MAPRDSGSAVAKNGTERALNNVINEGNSQLTFTSILRSGLGSRNLILHDSPPLLRIVNGSAWSLIGVAISRSFTLLSMLAAARILGSALFGRLNAIQALIVGLGAISTFGLGASASRFIGGFRVSRPADVGQMLYLVELLTLISGGVFAILMWLLAPWLAVHSLGAPGLVAAIRLAAFWFFLENVTATQMGELTGYEAFSEIARINVWTGVAQLPVVLLAIHFWGLEGFIGAMIVCRALLAAMQNRAVTRISAGAGVSRCPDIQGHHVKELLRFCVPLTIGSALIGPAGLLCTTLIVKQPSGYEQFGLFNVANQIVVVIVYLTAIVSSVSVPVLASLWASGRKYEFSKTLRSIQISNFLIAFPFALVAALGAGWIMALIGKEFTAGTTCLRILMLLATIRILQIPIQQAIVSTGSALPLTAFNALWAAVLIYSTWLFRHSKEIASWYAFANVLAYGTLLLLSASYLHAKMRAYPGENCKLGETASEVQDQTKFCIKQS